MPDLLASVRTLILQDSAITAIVSTRVYTDQMPQGAQPPAVVLFVDSEDAYDHLGGPQGFDSATVRIESYGTTRIEADDLRRKIRDHIGGYYGIVSEMFIQSVSQRTGQKHETVRRRAGTDVYRWIARQDFLIGYQVALEA